MCSALRRVKRLANATGSLASFRGIRATATSGLGAAFTAAAVGGGDTGRTADLGNTSRALFMGPELALLASLFVADALILDTSEPIKMVLLASVGVACATGFFVPSLSF